MKAPGNGLLVIQRRNRDSSMLLEESQAVGKLKLKIKQAKITKEEKETAGASLLASPSRRAGAGPVLLSLQE